MKNFFLIGLAFIFLAGCNQTQITKPDKIPDELVGISNFGMPIDINNKELQKKIQEQLETMSEYQLLFNYMENNYAFKKIDSSYFSMRTEDDNTQYFGISSGTVSKTTKTDYPFAIFIAVYPFDEVKQEITDNKKKFFYIEEHTEKEYVTHYVKNNEILTTQAEPR